MEITGGCNCGAARYRISAPPLRVSHCHCAACRRASGAAAMSFAAFPADAVTWEGKEPRAYQSSEFAYRRFCGKCGSQLEFGFDHHPEIRVMAVGCMDDPSAVPAIRRYFASEKVERARLDKRLPARPRMVCGISTRGADRSGGRAVQA